MFYISSFLLVDQVKSCDKRVKTPGMSPPRAGHGPIVSSRPKVKSCYNPLRLGTVIVLVSSGIDFVNTPRLYSDRATR